jgi:protein TonB
MRNHFSIAVCALVLASAAVAAPKASWTIPESDWGGAEPLNIREWYTFNDYPMDAINDDEQGFVTVAFTISVDGNMTDCRAIRSSGYRRLDAVPCRILTRRAKFKPAIDSEGRPRATKGTTSMTFSMPYQ